MSRVGIGVLVVGVAVALVACSGQPAPRVTVETTVSATPSSSASPTPTPSEVVSTPTPSEEPSNEVAERTSIGDHVEFADVGLTIKSAKIVKSIKTREGSAIKPGSGEDLVLVKSKFTELSKHGTDLSCGSPWHAYIQMWDDQGYEMQPVFDTYRIPGNPECNTWLLTGQSHDWNTAWRIVEGNKPCALTITDTDDYSLYEVIYLSPSCPDITLE